MSGGLRPLQTGHTQRQRADPRTDGPPRLLGCYVYLSGVTASVATALVHLGVDLQSIVTVQSPQDALARYSEQRHAKAAAAAPPRPLSPS